MLNSLFEGMTLAISASVHLEIRHADEKGYSFCGSILDMIDNKTLAILIPDHEEILTTKILPRSFGLGERDSIAIAVHRNAIVLTNERKVINFCERNGVDALSLDQLLRALWELHILSKKEVADLMDEMEKKDNVSIQSKEEILSD